MKNKQSKKYLIVVLIIALLAITLGYSLFLSELSITGTATASGSWDVHFKNVTKDFTEDDDNYATLKDSNKTLDVAVKLEYPGDSKTITVNIANDGELDAKLTAFTINAKDGTPTTIDPEGDVYTSGAIKMTLDSLTTGTTIAAGGSQTYTMKFEWPSDYDDAETVNDVVTFEIAFDYQQAN